ncbi:MAG: hypothetical protein KC502_12930, partial [Myxococcales bacterium]|nr:hypothetical protein [Myxococcales bacterium]
KTSDKSAPTSTTVETADGGQLFALLTTEGELEIAATGPAAAQATGIQVTLYDASGKPKTKRYFKMAREISLWELGDASAPPTDGSFDVAAQFLDAPGGQDTISDPNADIPGLAYYSFGKGTEKTTSQTSTKPRLL